jgi:predicted nucleic acid-binding Zn ribbon protein
MSYEVSKQRGRTRMLEIIGFVVAYLLIVNVVLPRFGIRFG